MCKRLGADVESKGTFIVLTDYYSDEADRFTMTRQYHAVLDVKTKMVRSKRRQLWYS